MNASASSPSLMDANPRTSLLIVVHPGSACGSSDFNLGADEAESSRDLLEEDIRNWREGIAIIDGDLSSELGQPRYADLGRALSDALHLARSKDLVSTRITGDDADIENDQRWAAMELVRQLGFRPETTLIELTGAWYDPADVSGCVNSVYDVLQSHGFRCSVRDSAFQLDLSLDNEQELVPTP